MQPAFHRPCWSLHNDKRDEADVTDDTKTEVVPKGLPDLDTIADTEIRHLAGLDCASTHTTQAQKHMHMFEYVCMDACMHKA